jgi:hypothetical protein
MVTLLIQSQAALGGTAVAPNWTIHKGSIYLKKPIISRQKDIEESALCVKKKQGIIHTAVGLHYGRKKCERLKKR